MSLELQEFQNTMGMIKDIKTSFNHFIIIIILTAIPTSAENHDNYQKVSKEFVFLNFNFGDHYVVVKEKRNISIDTGELTWYRYPGFSYTKPTYWYFINGVVEPFSLNMGYVNNELYDLKLISSNNYESIEPIKDIYVRKYGIEFIKEASGLGFSYTWLVNNMKVKIDRTNGGRGDCIIHYSIIDDDQIESIFSNDL